MEGIMRISSATIAAFMLCAAVPDAHALVESKCITPQGLLRGVIQILPSADIERRKPCVGMQTEVLTEVVDVFPRTRQAEQRAKALGLIPQAVALSTPIDGDTPGWVTLHSWPEHDAHIILQRNTEEDDIRVGVGCMLWFVVVSPGLLEKISENAEVEVAGLLPIGRIDVSIEDPPFDDILMTELVEMAPPGQTRMGDTIQLIVDRETIYTFTEPAVAMDAPGHDVCWGSVTVTAEPAG
jgi:hypothetical protein